MRSWAWALGVLAGITALLATTASAELWIPFVSSGSGKTAPVHQPRVARTERAERDRDARAKSEHEHKLRGVFGSGVVVPADDPAPPPPPLPPADAEEETGEGLEETDAGRLTRGEGRVVRDASGA